MILGCFLPRERTGIGESSSSSVVLARGWRRHQSEGGRETGGVGRCCAVAIPETAKHRRLSRRRRVDHLSKEGGGDHDI